MHTIHYLLPRFLKAAFFFFFAAFVWLIISIFYPELSIKRILSSTATSSSTEDWLPSPRKYSGLLGQRAATPNANTNVYTPGSPYAPGAPYNPNPAYNGYNLNNSQYSYSTYTYVYSNDGITNTTTTIRNTNQLVPSGTDVRGAPTTAVPVQSPTALTTQRNLTVRNLSIYEGGHVYTGLTFVGEAKSTMFRDGKFPIIVVDDKGRIVGVSFALATTNWSVPGWTRFTTKINYALPNAIPCTMVFEEALDEKERITRQPLRIPMQVRCN